MRRASPDGCAARRPCPGPRATRTRHRDHAHNTEMHPHGALGPPDMRARRTRQLLCPLPRLAGGGAAADAGEGPFAVLQRGAADHHALRCRLSPAARKGRRPPSQHAVMQICAPDSGGLSLALRPVGPRSKRRAGHARVAGLGAWGHVDGSKKRDCRLINGALPVGPNPQSRRAAAPRRAHQSQHASAAQAGAIAVSAWCGVQPGVGGPDPGLTSNGSFTRGARVCSRRACGVPAGGGGWVLLRHS